MDINELLICALHFSMFHINPITVDYKWKKMLFLHRGHNTPQQVAI